MKAIVKSSGESIELKAVVPFGEKWMAYDGINWYDLDAFELLPSTEETKES